jgi:LPS-assembly protein
VNPTTVYGIFRLKDLRLDPNTGLGTIKNATLHIQNVPVLYVPYFKFPIDERRMSGFLIPRFGSTSEGGFDLAYPFIGILPLITMPP